MIVGAEAFKGSEDIVRSIEQERREPGDVNVILCFWLMRANSESGCEGACVVDAMLRGVNRLLRGKGSFSSSGWCDASLFCCSGLVGGVGSPFAGREKGKNDVSRDDRAGMSSLVVSFVRDEFMRSLCGVSITHHCGKNFLYLQQWRDVFGNFFFRRIDPSITFILLYFLLKQS